MNISFFNQSFFAALFFVVATLLKSAGIDITGDQQHAASNWVVDGIQIISGIWYLFAHRSTIKIGNENLLTAPPGTVIVPASPANRSQQIPGTEVATPKDAPIAVAVLEDSKTMGSFIFAFLLVGLMLVASGCVGAPTNRAELASTRETMYRFSGTMRNQWLNWANLFATDELGNPIHTDRNDFPRLDPVVMRRVNGWNKDFEDYVQASRKNDNAGALIPIAPPATQPLISSPNMLPLPATRPVMP